jgi:hypothetical protein
MTRRSLALLVGLVISLVGGKFCSGQTVPAELPVGSGGSYIPGGELGQTSASGEQSTRQVTPSTDPRRQKFIDALFRQIGQFKPTDAPKKSLDDYFVLGTAEVNVRTLDAGVCFEARQGQRSVAEYLVDYVLAASEDTFRKWHVFSRHKDGYVAEQALNSVRMQYDQSLAYQAQLRQIYAAKTMRRT